MVRNWVLGRHRKGDIVSSLFSVKPPSCEHKHEKKKSIAFSLISYSRFFLGFLHRVSFFSLKVYHLNLSLLLHILVFLNVFFDISLIFVDTYLWVYLPI